MSRWLTMQSPLTENYNRGRRKGNGTFWQQNNELVMQNLCSSARCTRRFNSRLYTQPCMASEWSPWLSLGDRQKSLKTQQTTAGPGEAKSMTEPARSTGVCVPGPGTCTRRATLRSETELRGKAQRGRENKIELLAAQGRASARWQKEPHGAPHRAGAANRASAPGLSGRGCTGMSLAQCLPGSWYTEALYRLCQALNTFLLLKSSD